MHRHILTPIALATFVAALACGGDVVEPMSELSPVDAVDAGSASLNDRFAGNWRLVGVERLDGDGQPVSAPDPPGFGSEGAVGYLMYDVTGHMGVVIMSQGREPYAEDGPTPDQARSAMTGYLSYFGPYTIDETAGTVTHHVLGSFNPNTTGQDSVRQFEFHGDDTLVLMPPPAQTGAQLRITWEREPAADLGPEYERFVGFWRYQRTDRRTANGETRETTQFGDGYIIYTSSGHMAVHLIRPDRPAYQNSPPTDDEVLNAVRTYTSYFGPVALEADRQTVVHDRIGTTNPSPNPDPAVRGYEFRDKRLILSPPATTVDGVEVRSYLTWEKLN
jgi:hypothetical protein